MVDVEIKQLEYFVGAAKEGSISKASESMYVSQQALSKSIRSLEKHLGVELFRRAPTGVELTDCGKTFLEQAEAVLLEFHHCLDSVEVYRSAGQAPLYIGIAPFCFDEKGGTLSAEELVRFQQENRQATYIFSEMSPGAINEGVAAGSIDFGIAALEGESHGLEIMTLATYQMAAIVSKESPLFNQERITLEELTGGKIVPPFIEADSDDRPRFFLGRPWEDFSFSPVQVAYADASKLITDDTTVVIRPMQHALRTTSTKHVGIRPLAKNTDTGLQPIMVELSLFWKQGRVLQNKENRLVDFTVDLYRRTH